MANQPSSPTAMTPEALVLKWRKESEAHLSEAVRREMPTAALVAAARLGCADELERALAAPQEGKRQDPLGEALNSGDGSYRP